ncbi:MAG: nickel-responsive transcriptional regulator NikR [Rubrimonas sp.]
MQRITVSLDDDVVALIDAYMARHGATNRSEAMRDMARAAAALDLAEAPDPDAACVAALSFAFDADRPDLARRILAVKGDAHDLVIASTTAPLGHTRMWETTILRGRVAEVQALASALMRERGVRHGRLHMAPATLDADPHAHGDGEPHHVHVAV